MVLLLRDKDPSPSSPPPPKKITQVNFKSFYCMLQFAIKLKKPTFQTYFALICNKTY